jgi:hypothetical protein
MSILALHYSNFFTEISRTSIVWAIRDAGGFPAPHSSGNRRAMPFWSSQSRAEKVVSTISAYEGFQVVAIPLDEFIERWVRGLIKDQFLVGINWAGSSATGYDIEPQDFERNINAVLNTRTN